MPYFKFLEIFYFVATSATFIIFLSNINDCTLFDCYTLLEITITACKACKWKYLAQIFRNFMIAACSRSKSGQIYHTNMMVFC